MIQKKSPSLFLHFTSLVLVTLFSSITLSQDVVATTKRTFPNGPGAVLLNNGEVIQGNIRSYDSTIEIALGSTGNVTLPASQIAYVGKTLNDVYLHQVSTVRTWQVGDHFQMARWCVKNKLFDQAMRHYDVLKQQIPDRREFRQFDIEFKNAMLGDAEYRRILVAAGKLPAENELAPKLTSEDIENSASNKDVASELASSKASAILRMTNEDQENFLRKVQPVLAESCARAACHGAFGTTSFQVADPRKLNSRIALKQNLTTFTEFIVKAKGEPGTPPENHLLFSKSVSAHGQMLTEPLDITNPQHQVYLEQLRMWIVRATDGEAVAPSPVAPSAAPVVPAQLTGFAQPTFRHTMPGFGEGLAAQAAAANERSITSSGEVESLAAAIAKLEAIERDRAAKQDPFDPNKFNQQNSDTTPNQDATP